MERKSGPRFIDRDPGYTPQDTRPHKNNPYCTPAAPPIENQGLHPVMIGIDCGVETGVAVYNLETKKFHQVETMMIHQAMEIVLAHFEGSYYQIKKVRVEDARQATYKRDTVADKHKLQGAGSIKRDAKIWEDFLTDHGIPFQMVKAKKLLTKWSADKFKLQTGWQEKTTSHSRDAGCLVIGY